MKTMPKFKPIIRKIDEYEIYLRGDSSHYSAKTEKAAHEFANRIVKEAEAEWQEKNDSDRLRLERFTRLIYDLRDLHVMIGNVAGHFEGDDRAQVMNLRHELRKMTRKAEWKEGSE